jgi:hypothetical protein
MKPAKLNNQDAGIDLSADSLVRKSTIVYGIMAAIGLAAMAFFHDSLVTAFALPAEPVDTSRLLACGIVAAAVLLVLSYFFEDWFESFRELKAIIMQVLGKVSVPMAIYLSLVTSVGEELLFRGAIQPFAGVLLTSILFGMLHMGHNGIVSAWSFWALIAGYMLGWMYDETGSIWPSMIAHFGVNTVSILSLRRAYHGYATHLKAKAKLENPGSDSN